MAEARMKSVVMASYESAAIGEAMGLITDMLADPTLPQNIANGLKAIKNLLKSTPETSSKKKHHSDQSGGAAAGLEKKRTSDESKREAVGSEDEDEEDLPFTGERPSTLPKKLRHSLPMGLLRRLSTSTWTTTTSATGMPTMQPEAVRMRDYATDNFRRDDASHQPSLRQRLQISQLQQRLGEATIEECRDDESIDEETGNADGVKSRGGAGSNLSPVYVKPRSMSVFAMPTSARLLLAGVGNRFSGLAEEEEVKEGNVEPEVVVVEQVVVPTDRTDKSRAKVHDLDEEEISKILDESSTCPLTQNDQVNVWDFQIFQLSDMYKDTVLTMMSYKIFNSTGLLDTFKIPIQPFIQFFHVLEMGYQEKSYHNRIHATDVLHGVYYLITQPVPGLKNSSKNGEAEKTEDTAEGRPNHRQQKTSGCDDDDDDGSGYGIIVRYFSPLELMALLTAAAMHDYDHPGRTNAFLVATHHPLAVLYNDRSVLENHHAASAWRLFRSDPKYDWICHLDTGEQKRFRFLVIEAILATDLKHHFEIVAEFNAKVNETSGINWSVEADKLLVSNMLIKMADINGPCKALELHLEWTSRIHEEFFEQGDEENSMGLPISPYMDRNHPQLAKLQDSFITHLVSPLCYALANAHLLPGFWADDTNDDTTVNEPDESKPSTREVLCPLTFNLKQNHLMWTQILKQETSCAKDQVPMVTLTAAAVLQQQKQQQKQQQQQHQQPPQAPKCSNGLGFASQFASHSRTPKKWSIASWYNRLKGERTKDMDPIKEESPPSVTPDQPQKLQQQRMLHNQPVPTPSHSQPLPSPNPLLAPRSLSQEPRKQLQSPEPNQPQPPPSKSSNKKKNKSGEKSKSYSCSGFFVRKKQQ